MKSTKIMLGVITTFILVWLSVSFIAYILSDPDITFRQVATNGGMIMFLMVFGWIPSVIVGIDLEEKLS